MVGVDAGTAMAVDCDLAMLGQIVVGETTRMYPGQALIQHWLLQMFSAIWISHSAVKIFGWLSVW